MARHRQHFSYADTRAELQERKDARRGAAEDAFWDEDELVDYRPSKKKKKKRKRYPGCPGNDNGPHVYVWIDWHSTWFYKSQYEIKVCCGCEKRGKGFRRKND